MLANFVVTTLSVHKIQGLLAIVKHYILLLGIEGLLPIDGKGAAAGAQVIEGRPVGRPNAEVNLLGLLGRYVVAG